MNALRLYSIIDRGLRPVENAAALVAAGMVLVAMVLVSADALMRYAFSAPLTFQYQFTEQYLMVGLVTMPMAWGFRTGGFIRIEGFVGGLAPLVRSWLFRLGLFASSAYVAVLAWTAGRYFLQVHSNGDVVMGAIDWPISWSWIWVPVGCGLLALRLLVTVIAPDDVVMKSPSAEDEIL